MCGLQILLTIAITMVTTLEGRTILRQTDRRTNLRNVQRPYHQIQYNNNIRGFRLQRPNFPPNVISNSPRRDFPLQHMNWQIQTNQADTDDIHTTWQVRSRGTLLPSYKRRHFGFPHERRIGRLRQRIPQFSVHRSDADKPSVSRHHEDLSKRTDRRKVNINLALDPKDSLNGHVISVKAGNIRLSHAATKNAVIDLHNGGHRTRFTFSRKFQKTQVKAKTTNGQHAVTKNTKVTNVSKQAVMDNSIVNDVANSTSNSTSTTLAPTATLSSFSVASSSTSSSITSTTPSLTADASSTPAAEIQSAGNETDVISLNVTNIVQINHTTQADAADNTQTSADKAQTVVDKTQTKNGAPPELPLSADAIPGQIVSTPITTEIFRDGNSVAMTTSAYDVTTEEPDVGDAPDVDGVRNSFYADPEYD